ncbi:MAG: hypothetical protein Q9187_002415 [Circinaria calcarea]
MTQGQPGVESQPGADSQPGAKSQPGGESQSGIESQSGHQGQPGVDYKSGIESQPKVESQSGAESRTGVESQSGVENTFGRDRGGPDPHNQGPHQTSIANKLDPKVDSDGDGKPKSGPSDLETTTGPGSSSHSTEANTSSYPTGQTGSTSEYTGSTGGYTGSSGEYSSTTETARIGNEGPNSSGLANKIDSRVDSDRDSSSNTGDTTGGSSRDTYDTTGSNVRANTSTNSARRPGGESDSLSGPGIAQGANVTGAGRPRPEHETDKTGVTSMHSNDPKFQVVEPSSTNEPSTNSIGHAHGPIGGVGGVEPSVGADPTSGQAPKAQHQGAERPTEEPAGDESDAIVGAKAAAEKAQSSGAPGGGLHPGQEPESGPGAPSKGEGTGEKYVKTTGMAADGGDFDAAKPGAGREADRLLEEKGVHREASGVSNSSASVDTSDTSSKPSMGQKIKEKLHIG